MSPVTPSIGTRLGSGWGPLLNRTPWEQGTFGELLGDQVRFRIVRSGARSIDDIRPDSRAARELWKQPQARQFAQGILDLANAVSGTNGTPLRGFTLSTSESGYMANRAVHHFRSHAAPTRDAFDAGVAAATRHTEGTAAVRKGAWLHLDPERSAGLLHMLRNPGTPVEALPAELATSVGWGVKALLHELNHVGSPRPRHARHMDWLSEGSAETLARWPGRVEEAGRHLGVNTPRNVGAWFDAQQKPYQEEVDSVRTLLRLTGINPDDPKQFEAAEHLLNQTSEDKLPRELAQRIAQRNAPPGARRDHIARRIEQFLVNEIAPDGSQADPSRLTALIREIQ